MYASLIKLTYWVAIFTLIACSDQGLENIADGGSVGGNSVRPNIIILLADDLGYGDLGSYGSQSIETPYLDSLAAMGVRFTQFYAGSAVCSPSRACLLTGKFPLRFDVRQHFRDSIDHLPTAAQTLPEILKEAGYATAHIGKWHLGGLRLSDIERRQQQQQAIPGPLQHGFDHYLTNTEGAPIRPRLIQERKLYREGGKYLLRNDEQASPITKHWTEIKVDEAISLIDGWQAEDQPFFLNLWFDVPHTPYEPAPEPHLSKYKALGAEGDQLYFRSMVSHLDAQIGRLINHLKESGLMENTFIVFTSDNGPAYQGSPGPFKGGKTDLHEGGIRVPMFAVWPRHIPEGHHRFHPMHMADLLPTIADVAEIDQLPSDLDGVNMLPILMDEQAVVERAPMLWQMDLYQGFQNQGPKPTPYATSVALDGKWKLLTDSLQPTELFNLAQDHRELYNLKGQHPEIEEKLLEAIQQFHQAPRESWSAVPIEEY
ncbi:MAG: sulfatase-like hydrolase/transferase [Bacteroidota bacterium]